MRTKLTEQLSLEPDMIDKIEAILKDEIKDKYIPKSRFDEINDVKKKYESDLADRDNQLEQLKASTGNLDALKKQIENLQIENQKAKAEYDAQVKAMRRDDFVKTTLMESGLLDAKYIPGVSAYLPIAELDVDSVASVEAFKTKVADAKIIASAWFKSDAAPTTEINGLQVNNPNNKVAPTDANVDKNSYEYILSQTLKN